MRTSSGKTESLQTFCKFLFISEVIEKYRMTLEEQKKFASKDDEMLLTLESKTPKTEKCDWYCPCLPQRYLIAILAFFGWSIPMQ